MFINKAVDKKIQVNPKKSQKGSTKMNEQQRSAFKVHIQYMCR